jgi:mannose-6-phosphate isomerase-like protein (cupin superfamily)
MARVPFKMAECLISYSADKRAIQVLEPFSDLGGADLNCLFGVCDFADDASVHADQWERHPDGDEILCVLEGRLLATLELDGAADAVTIEKGQVFIVPQGSWHRLQVLAPGRLLFFTPTAGVELRPNVAEGAAVSAVSR